MIKLLSRRRLRLLLALVLPALAMHLFLPPGYMPGEYAGVGIALKFCGAAIPNAVDPVHGNKGHASQPCSFALGASSAPIPAALQLPLPFPCQVLMTQVESYRDSSAPACPRSQSPRGPPALA